MVADVGCNNPRSTQDASHDYLVRELLKNDVLLVETGCGAIASGKYGYLLGEAAMEWAGPGLREVCEATGMPPVLHMGSCVDNTRILTVLSQMANEGGLGEDISDVPAVGIAPEWMSEKALAIASYCAASGAYVILGIHNPVEGSPVVTDILSRGLGEAGRRQDRVRGRAGGDGRGASWSTSTRSAPPWACRPGRPTSSAAAATPACSKSTPWSRKPAPKPCTASRRGRR